MRLTLLLSVFFAILATVANADIVKHSVTYHQGGTDLEGFVAYNRTLKGKLPVVLIVHDWNGLDEYEMMRAERLAELGYLAFAVDIYGKGVRPKTVKDNSAEATKYYKDHDLLIARLEAGYKAALDQTRANPKKVAAIGYCFGGMSVLEMARHGDPLKGVVSFHGSLGTQKPATPGSIKAKVLVLHGEADTMVNDQVAGFKDEMKNAGADMKFVGYPGAKHAFTVKGSDAAGLAGVGYQAKADNESWIEMKGFLKSIFK